MLLTGFLFGLISSLHCIGMCGPIAMMLPVDHKNPSRKALQILTYHLGRISAYAMLGLAFGLLGRGLYLAGLQQQISIAVGLMMIIIAIVPEKKLAQYNFSKPIYKVISKLKSSLGKQFKKKTLDAMFSIGFLNGLLPCGLVYAALFGALAMQNVTLGITYMVLYGLGTIPMMSLVVYASGFISFKWRNQLQRVIPIITVLLGIAFIIRGLGLGIPYISPNEVTLFVQATPQCH
ncbi:sulfite exporter TauE/SafE family protein [Flavobacterium sp.]|mgnify:CR=1 FL=1|uniref:sulfite exporter TauE/SafE family protein n=1 Tax=Flavobacterium sp. TaxID=239 RepID=UPI002B8DCC09|nr:sulfite exporter TauE/SafE family protein [Flavobacterium sp.]HQA75441.1 sulfite exporter TauE/SafE family protein [Flavobacterium sp.]